MPARSRRTAAGDRNALGALGEQVAADWYESQGYSVADRNWRVREGELDLVLLASDGTIVFCEVKTRSSNRFGSPIEAVTPTKQRRLRTLGALWLSSHKGMVGEVRFDVAGVMIGATGDPEIEIVQAGF